MADKEKKQMSLDDLESYEAGEGIDISEFEGQKCKLAPAEIVEIEQEYDPDTGKTFPGKKFSVQRVKVVSEPVTEFDGPEGKIKIRASALFNLKLKDGKWGVSTSPQAKINKFLAKLKLPVGLEGVKKIGGQQMTMKVVTDDKGKDWLGLVF